MTETQRWRRIDELFHAALDRAPGDREAFLQDACADDPGLRAEVESLLRADGQTAGFEHWAPSVAAAWAEARRASSNLPADLSADGSGTPPPTRDSGPDGRLADVSPAWPSDLIGRTVAHYEIRGKLGAGGMGDVYLARDLRLARQVALKILPSHIAAEPSRLDRFTLEARAASALTHPNVAAIYELGVDNGLHFIAMEYVEGRTVEAVLRGGPVSLDRALDIARQIATALEDAHQVGITHRDIKPGNVMITPRDTIKVLDFGLAKLLPGGPMSRGLDEDVGEDMERRHGSPMTTLPGLVMGTVHYMSPEQALGRPVDPRSDLFSLGVVLYELMTGCLPFKAPSVTATIDAIVHDEPRRASTLRAGVPATVDRVLARALAKSPADRYQHARDLAEDLQSLQRRESPLVAARMGPRPWRMTMPRRAAIAIGVGLVLLTAAAIAGGRWWPRGGAVIPTQLPFTSFAGNEITPAFSPDGQTIAYAWDGPGGDNMDIYLQPIGGGPTRLTSDPAADTHPAFSPDATLVAFVRGRTRLRIVSRSGGPERDIATIGDPRITFAPDGRSIAAGATGPPGMSAAGIALIALADGAMHPLTSPPAGSTDIAPAFSPDGTRLAFQRIPTTAVSDVWIADADGGNARRLTFDDHQLEGPVWTQDGQSLVFASARLGAGRLWRMSAAGGTPEPLPDTGPGSTSPTIARAGERLAYNTTFEDTNIWELLLDGSGLSPGLPTGGPRRSVGSSTWLDGSPDVAADGQGLTFSSNRSGRDEIWVGSVNSVTARQVTSFAALPASAVGSPRYSPDHTRIVFDARVKGNADIYLVPAAGGAPRRLTTDPSADVVPSWSRDGRWIYFTSRRAGRPEVWRLPASGGREEQVTQTGGFGAQASLDGTFLLYGKERANSPLWRRPIAGGPEEPVLVDAGGRTHRVLQFASWRPTPRGVIFLEEMPGTGPGDPARHLLQAIDFTTRRLTTLAALTAKPSMHAGGIALTPDGRRLLFTQVDQQRSDILVMSPFR